MSEKPCTKCGKTPRYRDNSFCHDCHRERCRKKARLEKIRDKEYDARALALINEEKPVDILKEMDR